MIEVELDSQIDVTVNGLHSILNSSLRGIQMCLARHYIKGCSGYLTSFSLELSLSLVSLDMCASLRLCYLL